MPESIPLHGCSLAFLNRRATGYEAAKQHATTVQERLVTPDSCRGSIETFPVAEDIQVAVQKLQNDDLALVYSGGGDGTVNAVVAAMTGHVRNDWEATVVNYETHRELLGHLRYLAGADGNGNNFALSALGKLARQPDQIKGDNTVGVGYHRPSFFTVIDGTEIVQSGLYVSCLGLGSSANAAAVLDARKPKLRELGNTARLASEAALSFGALLRTTRFSVAVGLSRTIGNHVETQSRQLEDVTGLEFISSQVYAKQGRTPVNINDPYQQPVVTWQQKNQLFQAANIAGTFARLNLNRHRLPSLDLSQDKLSITVLSNQPVPFQFDGEIGGRLALEPGQRLEVKLGRIAIPTYMLLK